MLATVGLRHSESRIAADSQRYWSTTEAQGWRANSHWRNADVFVEKVAWEEIGARHLAMFEKGARALRFDRPWRRVVEWGCGGGANAVHFAPRADEFVGVDVSEESLVECEKQVAAVCSTAFRPVRVDVAEPEEVLTRDLGPCDIFLCFYVFELIPTPEYGERLVRIARELLAPGGLALIQIKYDEGRWRTRPRRRSYRSGLADMTTYTVPRFWQLVADNGLTPELVELVPRNELDERYAYFLASRPRD